MVVKTMSVYVSKTSYRLAKAKRLAILDEGYDLNYDAETKKVEVTYLGMMIVKKKWRDINVVPIPDPLMKALKETWEENHERRSMAEKTTGL